MKKEVIIILLLILLNFESYAQKNKIYTFGSITPDEYPYLKKFFNQIIKTQNSLITLEKI